MNLNRKIKTAILILFHDGPGALLKTLRGFVANRIGPYRPDESNIAYKALLGGESKGVMIDVGAHYGKSLSNFVQSGWKVFAFEPDSENRKRLNWSYGDLDNLLIDSRAVSDDPQENATLYKSTESSGFSSLSTTHPSHHPGEVVDVITLENFLAEIEFGDSVIDYLKVDTEGHDLQVLKGFPWDKYSPRLILCEFEDSKTLPLGYSFLDLAEYLSEKGYQLIISEWFPLEKYGRGHRWRRFAHYPCDLMDPAAWGNILGTNDPELYETLVKICDPET